MNHVSSLKISSDEIKDYLIKSGEISLNVVAEDNFRKNILIAAASFYEHEFCRVVYDSFSKKVGSIHCLELVRTKALSRQFYSYFDFDSSNTNRLFSAFGMDFKERAVSRLRDSSELRVSQADFLFICSSRNKLVHDNFAAHSIDSTSDEIYSRYESGCRFIAMIGELIEED